MYRQVDRRGGAGRQSLNASQPAEQTEFIEIVGAHAALGEYGGVAGALPQQTTRLVGRDAEIDRLRALLRDPQRRMITVTGPGGVGKTRLALDTARRAAYEFPDGVIFVSLAPIRDPTHVIPAIARNAGLHVAEQASVLDSLATTLHEQRVLLVLENFEQVVDAATEVAQLLAACPRLKVLITSRAPLRINDEYLVATSPLSLDTHDDDTQTGSRPIPGAVSLFAERARHIDPAFELTERNIRTVLEICRRLEGLPLAIELAAARIGAISPAELLERLDPRLPLLTQGNRDLPERQQTMRSAIAWSYDLLNDCDRRLFRWLSVFVGGFRLPAAESVAHAMQPPGLATDSADTAVLDGVSALQASNLLHRVLGASGEYRYAMLEVVREFGLELLAIHGELTAAQAAHIAWYASIRAWLDPNRFGPAERFIDHLWDIDAEHPNLREALANCEALRAYERMLDIAGGAAVFWHHRGFLGEGRAWLDRALDSSPNASPESRCWALAGVGLIRWTQGDAAGAYPSLLQALELSLELDHLELRALSLHILALADLDRGEHLLARDRIEQAGELWRALDLPSDEAMTWHILSVLPPRPGEPDTRMEDVRHCIALFESTGHTSGIAFGYHRLGRISLTSGDQRRAFSYFAQAIETWLSIDERWALNRSLTMLAKLAVEYGRLSDAATLLGIVDARLRLSGATLTKETQQIVETITAGLNRVPDLARIDAARQTGRQLTTDGIVTLLHDMETRIFGRSNLTQRETEVLQRIAAGDTDREIAGALFVSPRTVHTHVSHILTKLDVGTRREAVRRAHELGLLDPPVLIQSRSSGANQ